MKRNAPDVDAERDHLFHDLRQTGDLSETYTVAGFFTRLVLAGMEGAIAGTPTEPSVLV